MYEARVALLEMPTSERLIHLFWLSGPFILLVERTPADIWLSLLALAFVIRSALKRDGAWLGFWWVRSCFLFLPVFWFAQDKRHLYAMLFSTGVGMMVMTGILTAEMIVEGQKGGRLAWPYDDLVPGN